MPGLLGYQRSLTGKNLFSGLVGKIVLAGCLQDTLAPHLQPLSEVHNLEPSARPQKKAEKGKSSQIIMSNCFGSLGLLFSIRRDL